MIRLTCLSALLSLAACGGGGGDDTTAPDADTTQRLALTAWSESGDVFTQETLNTACFNTATSDVAQVAATITLTTDVTDFQTDALLPGAMVTAFAGTDQTMVLGTGTADAGGHLMIDITKMPTHTRVGFKIEEDNSFDTFLLNQYLDPNMVAQTEPGSISAVSFGTGAALPALVGISRTDGTGVLAGALRDCDKHELANFTATVSSTSGTKTPLAEARTFYFGDNGLPARNTVVAIANKNGLFTVLELPPSATAYVQMWGYLTQADADANHETLLSELAVPVIADNIITGSYELKRN